MCLQNHVIMGDGFGQNADQALTAMLNDGRYMTDVRMDIVSKKEYLSIYDI